MPCLSFSFPVVIEATDCDEGLKPKTLVVMPDTDLLPTLRQLSAEGFFAFSAVPLDPGVKEPQMVLCGCLHNGIGIDFPVTGA